MIKDIILNLENEKGRDNVLNYAVSLAEKFDAHLTGVAFANAYLPGVMMPDVPGDVIEQILAENERAARAAAEQFDAAAKRSLLSAEQRLLLRSEIGLPEAFSSIARRYDVSVILQSNHDEGAYNDLLIEATLFDSGRPVIVVPYVQKQGFEVDRIVCCWDGSRAAARAINDALPILKQARIVELFVVSNEKTSGEPEIAGAGIGAHLARHGLKVEIEQVPAADIDVGDVILSHVSDVSAGMIVMGGYGHSRFREFVLGGVTRTILSTMTVPVFMSN